MYLQMLLDWQILNSVPFNCVLIQIGLYFWKIMIRITNIIDQHIIGFGLYFGIYNSKIYSMEQRNKMNQFGYLEIINLNSRFNINNISILSHVIIVNNNNKYNNNENKKL